MAYLPFCVCITDTHTHMYILYKIGNQPQDGVYDTQDLSIRSLSNFHKMALFFYKQYPITKKKRRRTPWLFKLFIIPTEYTLLSCIA